MRFIYKVCICIFGCGFLIGMASASFLADCDARAADMPAQIVVDQQAGAIRFILDGREQARLDAAGLHVNGDINYTGALTDNDHYAATAEKREAR